MYAQVARTERTVEATKYLIREGEAGSGRSVFCSTRSVGGAVSRCFVGQIGYAKGREEE